MSTDLDCEATRRQLCPHTLAVRQQEESCVHRPWLRDNRKIAVSTYFGCEATGRKLCPPTLTARQQEGRCHDCSSKTCYQQHHRGRHPGVMAALSVIPRLENSTKHPWISNQQHGKKTQISDQHHGTSTNQWSTPWNIHESVICDQHGTSVKLWATTLTIPESVINVENRWTGYPRQRASLRMWPTTWNIPEPVSNNIGHQWINLRATTWDIPQLTCEQKHGTSMN